MFCWLILQQHFGDCGGDGGDGDDDEDDGDNSVVDFATILGKLFERESWRNYPI